MRVPGALALGLVLLSTLAPAHPARADVSATTAVAIADDLYYTRYCGGVNVRKVHYTYDGQLFNMNNKTDVASTNGADGIIFAPDGDLLVGGQGDRVHKVKPSNGQITTVSTGGVAVFHVALDPSLQSAWTAGLPGSLVQVPLNPFANGTVHSLSGDNASVTSVAFDKAGHAYYTASNSGGVGDFGTIDLHTFTTHRVLTGLAGAHGMTFDSFTGHLMLYGNDAVVQIDPATLAIVSQRVFPNLDLDQGTTDGHGHAYVASNNGYMLFIDYSGTGKIGDTANFVSIPYLDSCLDDVAPISGLGAPLSISGSRQPGPNASGWNNTPVTVSFTCNGGFLPLSCGGPTVLSSEGASQSVTGTVTDGKGDTASTTVSNINIDLTPPTTASQNPPANGNGWNNSDVTLSLSASDSLSGVAATEYSLDGAGWKAYTGALTLSSEGVHTLLYRSRDKADNVEPTRTLAVRIDKSCPEAYLALDPNSRDLAVYGRDAISGTATGPIAPASVVAVTPDKDDEDDEDGEPSPDDWQLRTYDVADQAGNTLVLVVKVHRTKEGLMARIVSLQYCGGPVLAAPGNRIKFKWDVDKGALEKVDQKVRIGQDGDKVKADARYEGKQDESHLKIEKDGQKTELNAPGLVLLRIVTHQGDLDVEY